MLPVGDPRSYGYVPMVDDVFYDNKIVPEVWDGPFLEILTFFTGIDNQGIERDFLALMNTAKGGNDAQFKPVNFP
jgi:hypothetical protein